MQRSTPIRVLIAERTPVLSTEVRGALARDPSFEVAGIVTSANEAARTARSQAPDIALCESTLPEPGAAELARFFKLRVPNTRVVFVTRRTSENELFEAVRAGAAAYLVSTGDSHAFLRSLMRVADGEFLIDEEVMRHPTVASRILSHFRLSSEAAPASPTTRTNGVGETTLAPLFVPLSAREIEILDLVARGNSNKLIARQLGISDQTVKNHITTILRKLEVNDRTEAVVHALRNGWIRIDAPASGTRR
jgi:DNA-binding NarL/FixJ family response regulator